MTTLNPATLVANLNGSVAAQDQAGATALTENGVLRYRPAKGARINWMPNSRALTNLTQWVEESGASKARVSGLSLPQLPAGVTTAVEVTCPGGNNAEGISLTSLPFPLFPPELKPTAIRGAIYAWADTPVTVDVIGFRTPGRGSGIILAGGTGGVSAAVTTTPQKFTTLAIPIAANETLIYAQLVVRFGSAHAANKLYVTCAHMEFQNTLGEWFDADWLAGATYLDPRDGRVVSGPVGPSVSRLVAMPEPAVTNLVPNPWCAIDNAGWSAASGAHTRDTVRANHASGHGLLTASGANARATISISAAATPHMALWYLTSRVNATRTIQLVYNGGAIGPPATLPPYGELIVTAPFTGTGSAAAFGVEVVNASNGDVIAIEYAGAHPGLDAPTPCPDIDLGGSAIKPGCSWGGTAHQSVSTRADSRTTIIPAAHITPAAGSLVYRWRKDQPTGVARVLLSAGVAGSGTDRMELRETADGHLQLAWLSNNAGETVVTDLSVTFARYGFYDLYAEWTGTTMAVAVDQGARTFGVRSAPAGNFGAGLLRVGG